MKLQSTSSINNWCRSGGFPGRARLRQSEAGIFASARRAHAHIWRTLSLPLGRPLRPDRQELPDDVRLPPGGARLEDGERMPPRFLGYRHFGHVSPYSLNLERPSTLSDVAAEAVHPSTLSRPSSKARRHHDVHRRRRHHCAILYCDRAQLTQSVRDAIDVTPASRVFRHGYVI